RMVLSRLSVAMVTVMSGLFFGAALLHSYARSDQPPRGKTSDQAASTSKPGEKSIPARRPIEIPAPRKVKVAAGRAEALVYALEIHGDRIPVRRDVPEGPAQEVVCELRWAVVTGIVDHRQVQAWFIDQGRTEPPGVHFLYRRVDMERQALRKDGTWSAWEPIP